MGLRHHSASASQHIALATPGGACAELQTGKVTGLPLKCGGLSSCFRRMQGTIQPIMGHGALNPSIVYIWLSCVLYMYLIQLYTGVYFLSVLIFNFKNSWKTGVFVGFHNHCQSSYSGQPFQPSSRDGRAADLCIHLLRTEFQRSSAVIREIFPVLWQLQHLPKKKDAHLRTKWSECQVLNSSLKWHLNDSAPNPPRAHVNLWDGSQVVDLAAGWLVMQQWYPCWNPQFFTSSYPVLANHSDIFWHSIWRSLWHSLLAFYLASILTFCLAFFLAFFLARVRVQAHSTASGARDMVSGAQSTVQQEEGVKAASEGRKEGRELHLC